MTNAVTNADGSVTVSLPPTYSSVTYIQIGPIGMTPNQWLMVVGGIVIAVFLILWLFSRTKD